MDFIELALDFIIEIVFGIATKHRYLKLSLIVMLVIAIIGLIVYLIVA